MSKEAIVEKIISDAHLRAESIIGEANAKADEVISAAAEECKAYLYNSTYFQLIQANFIDNSFVKLSCGKVDEIVHMLFFLNLLFLVK